MFGILGSPDVEWSITLDGGRMDAPPGSTLRATISLRPRQDIDARRVMAALVATEEYQYTRREHQSSGGSSSSRTWETNEVTRVELQLMGPGRLAAGELKSGPVEFEVPQDAAPSLESNVLRCRWRVMAWIDVGGRDPKAEQPVIVPLTLERLNPADAASMGEQIQTTADGQAVTFWTQPAPLKAGSAFSGALDLQTPLNLAESRIELKLNVATLTGDGIPGGTLLAIAGLSSSSEDSVSESQVLWRGILSEAGQNGAWRRYVFSGALPLSPIVTAVYPHGTATAAFDVVISRRLRPDAHITRPVAIVTG